MTNANSAKKSIPVLLNISKELAVYGLHAVEALLTLSPEKIDKIFISTHRQDAKIKKIIHLAQKQAIFIQFYSDELFEPYKHSQGVIAACKKNNLINTLNSNINNLTDLLAAIQSLKQMPLLLILDGVQDPHNLGACIRTANAAGAHGVIIPSDRAAPLNATVKKVACGAAEMTPVICVTNLARALIMLKSAGIWIFGLAGESRQTIYQENFNIPAAFVMGSEATGLRRLTQENCDNILSIPMQGQIESLNVSVAAGICLFEALRQRNF